MAAPPGFSPRIRHPVLFICDIQERFRPAIHSYPHVISTAQKMIRAADILKFPVLATTQQRGKLGTTCSELSLDSQSSSNLNILVDADKSAFSMWIPNVQSAITKYAASLPIDRNADKTEKKVDAIIVGIETHICVLQSALDLLAAGHRVWVLADGVSSCNAGERGVALERIRQEGGRISTSESVLYEIMRDAAIDEFKAIAALVKETKTATQESVQALCKI